MRSMVLGILFASQAVMAANLEDVIYKTDGSVLRGTLVEQDFTNGTYKIQLSGGSVFNVTKDQIEKITKEAPFSNNSVQGTSGININVANNPSINQAPVIEQKPVINQQATIDAYAGIEPQEKQFDNVFYVALLAHTVTMPSDYSPSYYWGSNEEYEDEHQYNGIKLSYQRNHSDHIAAHYSIQSAELDSIETVDSENRVIHRQSEVANIDYLGLSASILASTNLHQGWQFFAGLGIFNDRYTNDNISDDVSGASIDLGMGYSWQTIQVSLNGNAKFSDEYADDVSASNVALAVGFNY